MERATTDVRRQLIQTIDANVISQYTRVTSEIGSNIVIGCFLVRCQACLFAHLQFKRRVPHAYAVSISLLSVPSTDKEDIFQ